MDYHQILGVPSGATQAQIKAAYRKLALQYHPDRNQGDTAAEERFKQIVAAYQALTSPGQSFSFDRSRGASSASPPEPPTPRSRDPYFKRNRAYQRKPPEPVTFSRKTKLMGSAFIALLLVLIVSIPMVLQVYASVHNYNEGKALYENKRWLAAIQQLEWAYRNLGIRNLETARLMTLIMTENVNFYRQALPHINKGLSFSETSADSAFFYYKQGICFKNLKKYDEADGSFQNALLSQPQWDSAYYQLGEVHTFALQNYETGIRYFTQALEANPDYADCFIGRGYCHYQRKNFSIAVLDFNSFLKNSAKDRGTGFYLRGMALLESEHPDLACQDFAAAAKLGANGAIAAMEKNCLN